MTALSLSLSGRHFAIASLVFTLFSFLLLSPHSPTRTPPAPPHPCRPEMHRGQYQTLDTTLDSRLGEYDPDNPLAPSPSAAASSFLRRSNTTADSMRDTAPLSQDTPLMPLFTPVLQDFQHRFGSRVLQPQRFAAHDPDTSGEDSPPNFDEQLDEDEDDNDIDTTAQTSLLFARMGRVPNAPFATDTGLGQRPYFSETTRSLSPSPSPSPFALDSMNPAQSRGGESRLKRNQDPGPDHEASASLMIEMNQQQDDDETSDHWNIGERARRRFRYKRPGMDVAALAMWKWVNVENLDNFLARVSLPVNDGYLDTCLRRRMPPTLMPFSLLFV